MSFSHKAFIGNPRAQVHTRTPYLNNTILNFILGFVAFGTLLNQCITAERLILDLEVPCSKLARNN